MGKKAAWGSLLLGLAAAVLSSCFLLAQAEDIPVIMEPSQPVKGENVTLTPGGKQNYVLCYWYREREAEKNRIFTYIPTIPKQQYGPTFTGRETGGPGCTLHIRNLMLSDSGVYIVSKTVPVASEMGHVQIEVLARRVVNPEMNANADTNTTANKGAIAGFTVGAVAGTLLIGVLF